MRKYAFIIAVFSLLMMACNHPKDVIVISDQPPLYPDYTDVTIPYNIAPLNFMLRNNAEAIEVIVTGRHTNLKIHSKNKVQFSGKRWKKMLEAEKGNRINIKVTARVNGQWIQYAPFEWTIVPDKIDPYLSYRLIEPGYEVWNKIQIIERNLENFSERVIADNNQTEGSCMNCHIYGKQDPDYSMFHIRGDKGGSILNVDGKLRKLNTQTGSLISAAVYGDLHPSKRYGVFSSNIIIPAFHAYRSERLEVYDTESDIMILDFDSNEAIPIPTYFGKEKKSVSGVPNDVSQGRSFRTFPVFSADGKAIYYCDAPIVALPDSIHQLKYNLCRVKFDPENRSFGTEIDTLFSAIKIGKSVCHPKSSPNGKYIMYTVADYGTFPIWHREADLQLLDLETGLIDTMDAANAPCSDTYHSWSSDSRWFAFASKRDDGIYGKPYFCYIDDKGEINKPFVLPQKDPAFYDYTLKSFNIPELSKGQLPFEAKDIEAVFYQVEAEVFTNGKEGARNE